MQQRRSDELTRYETAAKAIIMLIERLQAAGIAQGHDLKAKSEMELAIKKIEEERAEDADPAAVAFDERYRALARSEYAKDGEIEIDDDAIVSESDKGAYVQAWVWVDAPETEEEEAADAAGR